MPNQVDKRIPEARDAIRVYLMLLLSEDKISLGSMAMHLHCSKSSILRWINILKTIGLEIALEEEKEKVSCALKSPCVGKHDEDNHLAEQRWLLCRDIVNRLMPKPVQAAFAETIAQITMNILAKEGDGLSLIDQ